MKENLSPAIKKVIESVKIKFGKDSKIADMFEKCYLNTLDTTIKKLEDGTTYIITGDIPAMWLRDSTAQIRPYIFVASEDEDIAQLIIGLIKRQFKYINIDVYANAFNEEANGACWEKDETKMNDWIWERKYEIDSLCYPIQLAYLLWKNTGHTEQFNDEFIKGVYNILKVFRVEQNHEENSDYRFIRKNTYFTDTLSREGKGALVKSNIGLTWSGFRPSDDACTYGYLIPSNMFAAVVLEYLEEIAENVLNDYELKESSKKLREEITNGIENYGITKKEGFGQIYAYEVDGYGQFNLMDDANVPSLLSMDYLGYKGINKEIAENTKRFILSEANPYYFKGKEASGIGSSHTPANYIWHISIAIQGLTAKTKEEKRKFLEILVNTDGDTGMMHEGFNVDNSKKYTREWFSWANALFCELILEYCSI